MRKLLTYITIFAVVAVAPMPVAQADIQDPPGARFTGTRKLSRGVANIIYGILEIPVEIQKVNAREGSTVAYSYGIIHGIKKTGVRFGYGVYEVLTFPIPTYKDTFRPFYKKPIEIYPEVGYEEFPPQFGVHTEQASVYLSPH